MRRTTRRAGRGTITGAGVLLAAIAFCAPAGAATLKPYHRYDGVRYDQWEVVYVAGAEANHVTLGGLGGRLYVLRDPNVPITTPPFTLPFVSKDPLDWVGYVANLGETGIPVSASYNCTATRDKGQGICVATPGTRCNDSGCYTHTDIRFAVAHLNLGDGNDVVTLEQGSSVVNVVAGAGNDTIDARNKAADTLSCGTGVDTVVADRFDGVNSDCESVTRS